jgi:hypothetical protein
MTDETRRDPTHTLLAFSIVGLFALTVILPYFVNVPEGQAGTLIVSGGKVVETVVVLVLGYFFGSSAESKKKTDALASVASNQAQATPAPGTATMTAAADVDAHLVVEDKPADGSARAEG